MNEVFKTEDGAVVEPEFIGSTWRLVVTKDGQRKIGKTEFSLRADALNALRQNSIRK